MPLFKIVRRHEFCVEAASLDEASTLLASRESDALSDGYGLSETVEAVAITHPGTVSDDLLDAIPYNGADDTARAILNR